MIEELNRAIEQLFGRISGPMNFRLLMQPAMAIFLAIRAGLRDSREKKPAFLWEIITSAQERRALIQSAWKDLLKLFTVACLLDIIYQLIVLKTFYLLQTIIVAIALAVVPYIILRGPVTRLVRRFRRK